MSLHSRLDSNKDEDGWKGRDRIAEGGEELWEAHVVTRGHLVRVGETSILRLEGLKQEWWQGIEGSSEWSLGSAGWRCLLTEGTSSNPGTTQQNPLEGAGPHRGGR